MTIPISTLLSDGPIISDMSGWANGFIGMDGGRPNRTGPTPLHFTGRHLQKWTISGREVALYYAIIPAVSENSHVWPPGRRAQ